MLEGVGADGAAIIACAPVAPCIGCDLAACIAPLLPALRALAPGAQREVPTLALEVFPQLALASEIWLLQRRPWSRCRRAGEGPVVSREACGLVGGEVLLHQVRSDVL